MKPEVLAYTDTLDCVHCGLCLTACPTYRELGLETDSPRGRVYLMRGLAEGRIDDVGSIRPHLDRCLDCRACESACPSGVRYGRILETVRGELEQQLPRRGVGPRLRGWLLRRVVANQPRLRLVFRLLRLLHVLRLDRLAARLRLIPRGMRELLPRIPAGADRRSLAGVHAPHREPRGRVGLFTGCVMEQLFGDINRKTVQLLTANGFEVVAPSAQGCCGALLIHDGQPDAARQLALRNLQAFADCDIVINNSAGCGAALKEYDHLLGTPEASQFAAKCRDISEFLAEQELSATPRAFPHRVAYDDPCHLCHGQGVRAQPRALLAQVPDIELIAHADPEGCCGSAGIYNLTHPELAEPIGRHKVDTILAANPDVIVTGNPGCTMQLRAHLRQRGSSIPVKHTVELLLP